MKYLFGISKGNPEVSAKMWDEQQSFIASLLPFVDASKADIFKQDMAPRGPKPAGA